MPPLKQVPIDPKGPNLIDQYTTDPTLQGIAGYTFNKDKIPEYLKHDLSEDNPLPWQRYLKDDVAQGIIGRYNTHQDAHDLSRGLDKPADVWGGGLPGDAGTMGEAIAQKYKNQVGDKLQSVKSGFETNEKDADELARASTMLGQGERIRMQNFKEQYEYQEKRRQLYQQWKNAQDQATAGFIGSLLSLGGTIIGTVIGGGKGKSGVPDNGGGGGPGGVAQVPNF